MMFKKFYLHFLLSIVLTIANASPAPTGVKREIGDARYSSAYSSYALPVTATLGSGRLSPLNYPGSIGNIYASNYDYYQYPGYATSYANSYGPYAGDASYYLPYGYESGLGSYYGNLGSYYGNNLGSYYGNLGSYYGSPLSYNGYGYNGYGYNNYGYNNYRYNNLYGYKGYPYGVDRYYSRPYYRGYYDY